MPAFDKRIDELGSPINNREASDNSSFTSSSIMQSPMEFQGLGDYGGFQGLASPQINTGINPNNHLGNFGEGVGGGGHQAEFKREFDGNMQVGMLGGRQSNIDSLGVRRPPIRQGSGSSYGMQMPRSIPEQYNTLQRSHSGGEGVNLGMGGNDLSFR